jgi:cephalosporin hydroxylase
MRREDLFPMRTVASQRKGLDDLIDFLKSNISDVKSKTMIEIGCYSGVSSVAFAECFGKVICVDPFIDDYDPNDGVNGFALMSVVEKHFDENTKNHNNIVKLKKTSDEAISYLKKNKDLSDVYFVYIDGLHTYEQVKKDIDNYMPIIAKGGYLGGHDYHENHQPVMKAVNEKINNLDALFVDSSFVKKI